MNLAPIDVEPAFHLRALTLGTIFNSAAVLHSLFTSSSSTLTSLTLYHLRPPLHTTLLSSLPLLANHLRSLTVLGEIPGLGDVLSTFPSLDRLVLAPYTSGVFKYLDSIVTAFEPPVKRVKLLLEGGQFGRQPGLLQAATERIRGHPKGWGGLERGGVVGFRLGDGKGRYGEGVLEDVWGGGGEGWVQ